MTTRGRLEGRMALITGASRGIGAAVARRFAEEGADLILSARTAQALESVLEDVCQRGATATALPADLGDFAALDEMIERVCNDIGRLDILVANGGTFAGKIPIQQTDPATWHHVMDVNLNANWHLIHGLDGLLRASVAGRVIVLSSGVTKGPRPDWGAYAVSKTAVEMMTLTYAADVSDTNIRVNLIDPGATRTDMRAEAYPSEDPMTLKSPEDLNDLFVDLASPECTRHGEIVYGY
jgi:NAD(P)-dependent dehydrogenase (short-subunit alcohol dehydrogenase family)